MSFIATIIAKLLDPISFVVILVISFFSRSKWIIPASAVIGAIVTETILASNQYTRTWGSGLGHGLVASGIHALTCYWLVGKFKKNQKTEKDIKTEVAISNDDPESTETVEDTSPINLVSKHLKVMGYDFTNYGAGVALLEVQSGYNEVKAASHIALTTMALDIKTVGTDIVKLASFVPHAHALLEVLKSYKDQNMMNPTQWQNDANAILRISSVDEHQEEWLEKVLGDPVAGKERLATSRIEYDR